MPDPHQATVYVPPRFPAPGIPDGDPPPPPIPSANSQPYAAAFEEAYNANVAKLEQIQIESQRIAAGLSFGLRRASSGGAGFPDDAPPVALDVRITGTPTTGSNLTGVYTYFDPNGDAEGTSTFAWLRDGVPIAGAVAKVYALVGQDEARQIAFRVTPVATVAPTTGASVTSPPVTAQPA